MKNLKVVCFKEASFNFKVLSYCLDSDNGITYILSNLFQIFTISTNENNPVLFSCIQEAEGKVISFEYLVEARGILVVLEDGQIYLIRKDLTRLIYKHDCFISSVALSPSQDLLALADEKCNLQLMSTTETSSDVLYKINSLETNESLNKPVGVGWGSKETQFFGLDGRQTQKTTETETFHKDEELIDYEKIKSSDQFNQFNKSKEKTISIDWRGDGQLLATLSYLKDLNKHCLKVWNKRLELQYMSDKLIEIEKGILSYVPDGQFICCAQRRESTVTDITFFEKNGLVRHRFSLPSHLKMSYVQTMAWSPNSEILAIIVKQFTLIEDKICVKNMLLLYTMGNWHYYLKFSCYLHDDCDYLMKWNPNLTNQLHLLNTDGHYNEYDIYSCVDYCYDNSTVYVIDGRFILITRLERAVIPPPMYEIKLDCENLICKIDINNKDYTKFNVFTISGKIVWRHSDGIFIKTNEILTSEEKLSSRGIVDPEFIHTLASIQQESISDGACISLAKNLCLKINDITISSCCTSYRVTDQFIVFTTNDNSLQFLPREDIILDKNISEDLIYSQPIENGGFLISASELDSKVVLQMPRGNLETIYPRLFVLSKITWCIKNKSFLDAFKLARRHRVNMNFLVEFSVHYYGGSGSELLINELALHDPSMLCIILTELDNSDTSTSRYGSILHYLPSYRPLKEMAEYTNFTSRKINTFCEYVSEIERESNNIQPILQSLVKMEPKKTEEALEIIFHLENQASRTEAIKFMLYFIDIDELFKSSLCTYNTDITIMVASLSNKDPKQYLTFIDELENSCETIHLKHYRIDLYVKRYDKAFKNLLIHRMELEKDSPSKDELAKIDEELTELLTSKKIYRAVVRIIEEEKGFEPLKALIWAYYADYLLQKRHYQESGWAYSKAYRYSSSRKNYDLTLMSYAFVDDWEKSIAFIAKSSMDESIKVESLGKISNKLLESRQSQNACLVLAAYHDKSLDDMIPSLLEEGSWYLVEFFKGKEFSEQWKLKTKLQVMKQLDAFCEDISSALRESRRLLTRLEAIQKEKLAKPKEVINYISDTVSTIDGSEISSLSLSDSSQSGRISRSGATSIKTRSSVKSTSTNKKRVTLNEGSRYEDLAIIIELRQFLIKQSQFQAEGTRLVAAAFQYCPFDHATYHSEVLHNYLGDGLKQANIILDKLWPPIDTHDSLSVVKRIERHFQSSTSSTLENVDFQICIKPDLPKQVTCFDI